jgi:hypothetical protein
LHLRELLSTALKETAGAPDNVVSLHEHQTDAIAAGDAAAAVQSILSWGESSRAGIREALGGVEQAGADLLKPASVVEDLSIAQAKEQSSLAGDVDALVAALDARAAMEIGIGTPSVCRSRRKPSARRWWRGCGHLRRSCAARAPLTCSATFAPTTRFTASSSA